MRKFLLHFFYPASSNNHRPKLLHLKTLFILTSLLLFSIFPLSQYRSAHPQVLGVYSDISFQDLLVLTNKERQAENVPSLVVNFQLEDAADMKASDMFEKGYWAHNAPDGTTPWDFIKKAGYDYVYAGENLARGFTSAQDVIKAWMASPEHRANMLSRNFSEVGFSVQKGKLEGEDTVLVVEELGGRDIVAPQATHTTLSETASPRKGSSSAPQAPKFDSKSSSSEILLIVIGLIISTLVLDLVVVEKKKIRRFAGHNLDHILFLIMVILSIIILGRGVII